MKSICIKTNNPNLQNYLLNELNNIELSNICFCLKNFKHYTNIIIHYTGNESNVFIDEISNILSFLVIDELEESFLRRLIIKDYFYFNKNEIDSILNICFDIICNDFSLIFDKKLKSIYSAFSDYIKSNNSIILTGFINFKLKKYFEILENIVSEAVNNYIVEKEYLEFISLLKLYINNNNSNCKNIHMIYCNSESILLDDNNNIIKKTSETLNRKFLSDISFSSNDYTLNSLLSLLPEKIYIHLIDNYIDEFINTLQLVFGSRIILCNECTICSLYKNTSTKKDHSTS